MFLRDHKYKNGNYYLHIDSTGTKTRIYPLKEGAIPNFPETIDLNISNQCDMGCKFCYQNASPKGKVAKFEKFIPLLDTIPRLTEIALNGNDVLNPEFLKFINYFKSRDIICNVTVNYAHYRKPEVLRFLITKYYEYYINGLGISLTKNIPLEFFEEYNSPNIVFHTIVGITSPEVFKNLIKYQKKFLILGYKEVGRGKDYISCKSLDFYSNFNWLKENIKYLLEEGYVVSFDNLALKQLDVKQYIKNWDMYYMGDDGKFSFYIDLVKEKFYKSSTEDESNGFTLTDNIKEMFDIIRSKNA